MSVSLETQLQLYAPLDSGDTVWLERVSGEPIDEYWLEEANNYFGAGLAGEEGGGRRTTDDEIWARSYFFEELMGFGRPESPLYKAYQTLNKNRRTLIPTDRFVRISRQFVRHELDPVSAAKFCVAAQTLEAETLDERVEAIFNGMGVEDGRTIIDRDSKVLTYEFLRKVSLMGKILKSEAQVSADATRELVVSRPSAANGSETGLRLKARYMGEHGGDIELTVSRINNLLFMSPDKMLVAVEEGVGEGTIPFTKSEIKHATAGMTQDAVKERAGEILVCDIRSKVISGPIRELHQQYHGSLAA